MVVGDEAMITGLFFVATICCRISDVASAKLRIRRRIGV